jgi:hypothetical protein
MLTNMSEQYTMSNMSDQESIMSTTNTSTAEQQINSYIAKQNAEKKNLIDKLSKQEMANIIFKQNDVITQQSSQMLEIIDMANIIEQSARFDEVSKCDAIKKNYNNCSKISTLQKHHMKTYVNSVRIQIILFILFLVMITWLLYHYVSTQQYE